MARKDSDNFYRRQQEEANRLAATQNRHLNEVAKLAKSGVEEMRKMRRAFETFTEAVLGMKVEPFQGAVLSEAARGQVAEFDIKGFRETLLKGEALTVPEGKPYPKVDIAPKPGQPVKTKIARLGYGDVVEANEEFIAGERESGKTEEETADLGLVIGVDLAESDPAQHALIMARRAMERSDSRWTIICDEAATRELLLAVEEEAKSASSDDHEAGLLQRQALVERIRDALAAKGPLVRDDVRAATVDWGETPGLAIADEAPAGTVEAAIQEAIDRGEHPEPLFNIDTTPDPDGWKARYDDESTEDYVERFLRYAGARNGTFRVPGVGNFIVRDGEISPVVGAYGPFTQEVRPLPANAEQESVTMEDGCEVIPAPVDEVLPPGVTPKMMADHPEFAAQVRGTIAYREDNANGRNLTHEVIVTAAGHMHVPLEPTSPGESVPVTRNGKEIGRATINEDGTGTVSINGEASGLAKFATGGYTGTRGGELAGIVHEGGSFVPGHGYVHGSDNVRRLIEDAGHQRRDGLASY